MKEDWLDNSLGDKLDGYESPLDLENAWESFQAKREAPKKKNRFFFLWILLGVITIGLGGSYLLLNDTTSDALTETIIEEDNSKTSSSTLVETEKTNSNNNTFTSNENRSNATENISYENQNASVRREANSPSSKVGDQILDPAITHFAPEEKQADALILPVQNEEEGNIETETIDANNELEDFAITFLPSLKSNALELPLQSKVEILNASFSDLGKKTIIKSKSLSISPFHFGIVAGYGLRSKGKVLSNEKPLDVISTNLFLEKRIFSDRLYLKTGINFDLFVNKVETSTETDLTQLENNQLIAVNHFQDGTIQEVFGVGKIQTIEKTTTKNFNRYRLISVPLILGYDVVSSNRIILQVEGGMARSIFGNHSGKDFDLVDSDFEHQGVWQGLYGLNLNYNLGRNLNIFSSVKGNYHLNKIGKSEQLEMEKFRFHQVQIGLRFKL